MLAKGDAEAQTNTEMVGSVRATWVHSETVEQVETGQMMGLRLYLGRVTIFLSWY